MNKWVAVALFTVTFSAASVLAEEKQYQIDPVHSSVQFRIRHLYSTFVGRFNKFDGTLSGDPANPATLTVSATVDIASIDTANGDRDKHLKTPDFFDEAKHPKATFVSTKTAMGDTKDSGAVTGKLTIHGVTKEVTFKGQFLGHGPDPKGVSRAGFHATTTLKRSEFGILYNSKLPSGLTTLGDDVELILDLEAIEVQPAAADKTAGK